MDGGGGVTSCRSILEKPLSQLTEEDISQLTREDCRKFLKEKGMRRPSWNKSQAIQQVISLKALLETSEDSGAGALRKVLVSPIENTPRGSDAFSTTFAQYKPHDDHSGIRQRRRTNVPSSEDDQHQESHIQNDDPLQLTLMTKRPSPMLDLNKFYQPVEGLSEEIDLGEVVGVDSQVISPRRTVIGAAGTEVPSEDDFINSSLDLGGADVDSPMISPPTVIAEAGIEHHIDIPGGNSNDERKGWDFELIFVITNVVLESMSAIFTQLSSKQKPQYALFGVLVSYLALLTCIIEIIYEGHQQILIQSFATLNNIVALACALGECVVTTINYRFEGIIKLTVLPIILANGVLFSKILKYWQRSNASISFKKTQ